MSEEFICETCGISEHDEQEKKEENKKVLEKIEKLKKNKNLTVIEIGADWCPRCKQMKAILDSIEPNYKKDVEFEFLDCNEDQDTIVETFDVMSLPTVIFMKDGKIVYRFDEMQSKIKIVEQICKYK